MKRLYLSETDKKVGGVCGGIGETYEIDPTLIRLIFVFVDLATGIFPLLIAYVVAWAMIPKRPIA